MLNLDSIEPEASAPVRPTLPKAVKSHLGEQLRSLYIHEKAAVSTRLVELLNQLEAALAARGEAVTREVRAGLIASLPNLQKFAMSLAKDSIRAEDLVQETLLKGWKYRHLYQPGTNLEAWLFTIQRNLFYSQRRKRAREAEDPNEEQAARLSVPPTQGDRLDLEDVRTAMAQLPQEQQEALTLVVFNEMSYEKAAELMNSKTGTIKSRVNRARNHLFRLLGYEHADLRTLGIYKNATPSSWTMLHNDHHIS